MEDRIQRSILGRSHNALKKSFFGWRDYHIDGIGMSNKSFCTGGTMSEVWACLIRDVVSTSDQCNLQRMNYLLARKSYQRYGTIITGQQRREDNN